MMHIMIAITSMFPEPSPYVAYGDGASWNMVSSVKQSGKAIQSSS